MAYKNKTDKLKRLFYSEDSNSELIDFEKITEFTHAPKRLLGESRPKAAVKSEAKLAGKIVEVKEHHLEPARVGPLQTPTPEAETPQAVAEPVKKLSPELQLALLVFVLAVIFGIKKVLF